MHISHITIKNFRALEDISFDLGPRVNVIVGPNGVGKTTILQAARLLKALSAPRTQHEVQQVLISLGAASPHFPQRIFLNSLARDLSRLIEIRCSFTLTDEEILTLRASSPEIVRNIATAQLGQGFVNPAALIQYFDSPQGRGAIASISAQLEQTFTPLERDKMLLVGITLDPATGQINSPNPINAPLIGFLDQRLPPSLSLFSYFPADRALPMGEVNLQLGGPDAQQQLESHNSQPQTKYLRLKNLIINSLVIEEKDRTTIHEDFQKIFSGLLRGRTIKAININELGLLSVVTEEVLTGRLIEIDSLSSGEKNIALTFLLVARSVAKGGIALFDEPELHLNPAVSRDVLSFMIEQYSAPRDIQFIMCTHSPEILSSAFSNENCNLLHLKSSSNITRVGKSAYDEHADALQRLGSSVTESLMYEGTVFVEGESDVSFLQNGFPEIFKRYIIKDTGGRREIERSITEIQSIENGEKKVPPIYFIFDHDGAPTNLSSSKSVRIHQWQRRCVENYMIDVDVIAEILKDPENTHSPIESEGEVQRMMRELAYQQLDSLVAKDIYESRKYETPSIHREDLKGDIKEITGSLFGRMTKSRNSMPDVEWETWSQSFATQCSMKKEELQQLWEVKWRDLCDGKRLISDLHKAAKMKMSEAAFKAKITQRMRDTTSETWQAVKGILQDFIVP
ncbi:MAG: DUF4435 domain-containing protein [Bradyrhizobiaceae bacterium]|nr:MAG: DUF4435 domain-containing protein [Bradyrhizobiaceae bacterium]